MVVPGVYYWKLVNAIYMDPTESNGESALFLTLIDEKGAPAPNQRILQVLSERQIPSVTDSRGTANPALSGTFYPERGEVGPMSAWVDDLPSDRVTGLGRPHNQVVSFRLTWQKTKK